MSEKKINITTFKKKKIKELKDITTFILIRIVQLFQMEIMINLKEKFYNYKINMNI